jgi:uncharacterized MAPEG superfamily protein
MTPALVALALSGLLLAAQLVHVAIRANREIGPAYFLTPRDTPPPRDLSRGTARLKRAYQNHVEAFPLFAAAVLVAELSGSTGALTTSCAFAYLAARVAFVPAYLYGWTPWRSVFFGAGFGATLIIFVAALV